MSGAKMSILKAAKENANKHHKYKTIWTAELAGFMLGAQHCIKIIESLETIEEMQRAGFNDIEIEKLIEIIKSKLK